MTDITALVADLTADWRSQAKCRGVDVNMFFVRGREARRRAQEFCRGCPVISECAAFGAQQGPGEKDGDNAEITGRWAGFKPGELRRMRDGRAPGWDALMAGRLPEP